MIVEPHSCVFLYNHPDLPIIFYGNIVFGESPPTKTTVRIPKFI